jgi:hypothetical protein
MLWRRRCRGAPAGGSYARWHEPFAALFFRLLGLGAGVGALTTLAWIHKLGAFGLDTAGAGQAAARMAIVVPLSSHIVIILLHWITRPVRIL